MASRLYPDPISRFTTATTATPISTELVSHDTIPRDT